MRAGNGYRSWLPGETAHARAGECLSRAGTLLPSLSAETAMTELIAHLGRTLRADRCRMFEYDGDLLRFRNSHEWCALGVGSHLADLQDTPVAIIAWLHRDLLAGRTVMIDDVAALPAPARAFKRELLRQQVKSMLSAPIFQAGRLRACLALDAVQAPRAWRDDEAALLDLCARLIGAARYQSQAPARDVADRGAKAPLLYLDTGAGRIRGVPLRAIVAVRSMRNATRLWIDDGSVELDRRPLHVWRTLLPQASFPSIHRTAIVNLSHVAALDKHAGAGFHWQLRLRGVAEPWPVSRPHHRTLTDRLGW